MKIENLMDLCRACLSAVEATGGYNIFETPELYSKFQACTALTPEVTFPNVLCPKCYTKVQDFQEFRNMCIESDKKLQNFDKSTVPGELDDEKPMFDLELAANAASAENIEAISSSYNVRRRRGRHMKDDKDPLVVLDKGYLASTAKHSNKVVDNGISRRRSGRPAKQSQKVCVSDSLVLSKTPAENEKQELPSKSSKEDVSSETLCRKKGRPVKQRMTKKKKKTSRGKLVEPTVCKCDQCPKRFLSEHSLVAHKRTHDGLVPYPCTYDGCDKGFNRLHHLSRHLKDHEGNNCKFACDQSGCTKEYKYKSALNYHLRKNHNIGPEFEPQICEICGKFFKSAAILKEHRFTHREKLELPHACEKIGCTRRFATKDRLRVHILRHDGIKRYACPHCGMRKTTRSELKVHINYHTLERTWTCRYCNKIFNRVGNHNMHVRTVHERAKDYPCRFCERKFGKLYTRKCHEMTHTGERPHECGECGKRFTQMSALNTHRKLHLKQRKEAGDAVEANGLVQHITAQE